MDVSLPCGRSHGVRNDGCLYDLCPAIARLSRFFYRRRFLEASREFFIDVKEHQRESDRQHDPRARNALSAERFAKALQCGMEIDKAPCARSGANSGKAGHSRRQRPGSHGLGLLSVLNTL